MLLLSPHLWNEKTETRVCHWTNIAGNWHLNLELKVLTISLYNHPTFPFSFQSLKRNNHQGWFTLELKTVDEGLCWESGNPALGTSPTWVYYMIRGESPIPFFCSPAGSQDVAPADPSRLIPYFSLPSSHFRMDPLPLVSGAHVTPCALMPLFWQFLLPAMLFPPFSIWIHSSSLYLDVILRTIKYHKGH